MITNQELSEVNLSPTKKDFYQIWQELMDTAKKISNRWDPSATNESDPGIVLLKVATALADKLFYNIDKNILEDYMPSAAQVDSMRKLCDMMGYNMKYYQSATTTVNITYTGDHDVSNATLSMPIFTVIKDTDDEITYVTTEEKRIVTANEAYSVSCIEGQVVQCETSTDNIVSINMLDDLYRYYLPEVTIAENGVFVYNISDDIRSERWEKVDNLNSVSTQTKCYKFGYDSSKACPYLQFPEDVGQLIEDGLEIYYIRTNGVNGNISRATLCKLELPSTWSDYDDVSEDDFTITNTSATVNGADPEGIDSAYNAYKKTIGTFDTLVTCRDYMNAIYNLFDDDGYSLCSNVIVSDIRDDINRAVTLCTFNDYGISYKEQATQTDGTADMSMFDLVLYPFKTYKLTTQNSYNNSFTYYADNINAITNSEELTEKKTIAHNITTPNDDDVVCIKNYIQLNIRITPTTKVTTAEQKSILSNIKKALYDTFNMRQLDFGEEIPTESIKDCVKSADSRIRNVDMYEPNVVTKFAYADGSETWEGSTDTSGHSYEDTYNKLLVRNIIAGRIPLFKYNTTMQYLPTESAAAKYPAVQYPSTNEKILKMSSACNLDTSNLPDSETKIDTSNSDKYIKLFSNEVIQFRAPSLETTGTYSAYVNYYFVYGKASSTTNTAVAATFNSLRTVMAADTNKYWSKLIAYQSGDEAQQAIFKAIITPITIADQDTFDKALANYGIILHSTSSGYEVATTYYKSYKYFCLPVNASTYASWFTFVQNLEWYKTKVNTGEEVIKNYEGLYRRLDTDLTRVAGKMVDSSLNKYQLSTSWHSVTESKALDSFFLPDGSKGDSDNHGLGIDGTISGINADQEYRLTANDCLVIIYTKSDTDDDGNTTKTVQYKYYGQGQIIKPNFDLYDSATYHKNGHAFEYALTECKTSSDLVSKLTAGKVTESESAGSANIASVASSIMNPANGGTKQMYITDTDEQIELRDVIKVDLAADLKKEGATTTQETAYLYWTLQEGTWDDVYNLSARLQQHYASGTADYKYYVLQDNEAMYYTDAAKTDLISYGSGTEIRVYGNLTLNRSKDSEDDLDTDELLTSGLSAIPWLRYTITKTNYIELQEYQYVNLVEGNKLLAIDFNSSDTSGTYTDPRTPDEKKLGSITTTERPCKTATYQIGDTIEPLPELEIADEPWKVHTILQFNMGPTLPQALENERDSITLYNESNNGFQTIQGPDVSIKSNYLIQQAAQEVSTTVTKENLETGYTEDVNDFTVRVTNTADSLIAYFDSNEESDVADAWETVSLHNFGDVWTKIPTLNTQGVALDHCNINIAVPDGNNCLIMVYASYDYDLDATDTTGAHTALAPTITSNYTTDNISIFNASNYAQDCADDWWTGLGDVTTTKPLKNGINIIQITSSCTITLSANKNKSTTLIISDLDIINSTDYINQDVLCYKADESQEATALLKQIAEADINHAFYYNCPMDNSTQLDINTDAGYTMESARTWYDYNNINNKFVISEIDSDYLDTGITISAAAKL